MSHIFISYARKDKEFAKDLAQALENRGFSVWWDWDLIGGTNYRERIREAINEAQKAIVLWSQNSVASGFVIDEANEAKRHGKLVPVLIDQAEVPFGFGELHTISVQHVDDGIDILVAALNDQPPPRPRERVTRRAFNSKVIASFSALLVAGAIGASVWHYRGATNKGDRSATNQEARTPHRIALVIGNSEYKHLPPLGNPVRDAERVSGALEERGFKVIKALNVDKQTMAQLFTEFENTLAVVGGVGLFFYSGSAAYIDGEDILIPIDAKEDKKHAAIVGGLNLTRLRTEVHSRTTTALRDNGTAVIYSASKGQLALDGPSGGNSPFTSAFLSALSQQDELGDTFRKIRLHMEIAKKNRTTNVKQDPYFESNLGFKFYFDQPHRDPVDGVSKILIFDSCRDNPFKLAVAAR